MAIDPSAGFSQLVNAWKAADQARWLNQGQAYWHAGNTLDTYVTYLVQSKQSDVDDIVADSYPIFMTNVGTSDKPGWWRDDYGWWGLPFLNAGDPTHAPTLGLSQETIENCFKGADFGWQIMNYDWDATGHNGVRNDPKGGGVANTITNVLFLMLSLRRYETTHDSKALDTAGAVFDWFYPNQQEGPNRLFNKLDLIRETPGSQDDRAWTGDQGWFWRACLDLNRLDSDPDRRNRIEAVTARLGQAVLEKVFVNGVVRELAYFENYDVDYATGIGVFIRQFAIINELSGNSWKNLIQQSAQAAWDYSGWNNTGPTGCWHPDNCEYHPDWGLWNLTLKTSAQDAFNAYLTIGP